MQCIHFPFSLRICNFVLGKINNESDHLVHGIWPCQHFASYDIVGDYSYIREKLAAE